MASRRHGFTFIEVSVIIVVLMLMAVIVMPYATSTLRSQRTASFRMDAARMFRQAKELAVAQNQKHVITYNGGVFAIQAESEADAAPTQPGLPSNIESEDSADSNRVSVSSLSVPEGVTVDQVWLDDEIVESAGWEAEFFPNGTAARAGIEYSYGGRQFWIRVDDKRGAIEMGEGPYPAEELQRWEAGNLEQRVAQ